MDIDPPRITVVLRTYQRKDLVLSAVRALGSQEGAEPFEVVVVVDGSTDGSAAALRELQPGFALTVIEQTNQGGAAASNRGAAAARGELVLLLDDDMEADPRLLAEHSRSHREGADVVFGHIPLHPESPPTFLAAGVGKWAEERRQELLDRGGRLEPTDFLNGQMSLSRELFLQLGGFDENFQRGGKFGGADFDFGLRLAKAGYRMVFNPDAISFQHYVVTPRRYLRQWRDNGRARVMLIRKHPELAPTLLSRTQRRSDRLFWRWFRLPLRSLMLTLVAAGSKRPFTIRWFYRVQDLQYFAGIRAAGGVPQPRAVRVLCYHSIADLKGAGGLAPYGVPPARFQRQLRLLARFFTFIDAAEFSRFLSGAGVPPRAMLVTFDDGLLDLRDVGLPMLRELYVPAVAFAVTGLLGRTNEWSRDSAPTPLPLLDADGLRTLQESDIAIGAHTRTHRSLSGVASDEASEEVEGSIADLESLGLGRPSLFAYPYGEYDDTAKTVAAAAGLAGAFTTKPGLVEPGADSYELPRIEIYRRDVGPKFVWKVATGRRTSAIRRRTRG